MLVDISDLEVFVFVCGSRRLGICRDCGPCIAPHLKHVFVYLMTGTVAGEDRGAIWRVNFPWNQIFYGIITLVYAYID